MKIGLWCKHAGLIDLMENVLENHDVRLAPRWDHYPKTWDGTEDVIISTLPYDAESLLTGKPTIVYYTDPTWPDLQNLVQARWDARQTIVIGAENCYPDDLFIKRVEQFIPFALKPTNYPPYTGYKPYVAVINQKPHERWDEVIRGATGLGMTLHEFFGDIPYKIIDEDNKERFRENYADNRVLFYFSNSPYTIVMWEAMTSGMPIVAWDHHHRWEHEKPIHKYLFHYTNNIEEARTMLRDILGRKPERIVYPMLPDFNKVKEQWEELLWNTVRGFRQ